MLLGLLLLILRDRWRVGKAKGILGLAITRWREIKKSFSALNGKDYYLV